MTSRFSGSLQSVESESIPGGNLQLMGAQNEQGRYPWPLSEDAIRLAATIKASCAEANQIILFTGVAAREGVSTVAAQVALALAQMDQGPVLLLDANLRTPSGHATFQVQQVPGLSELIEQKTTLHEAIHPLQHSALSVLSSGSADGDALALFPTPGCSALMQTLHKEFHFVIVDSSPLLQFADTTLLVPYADGVVVTVAAGMHRRSEILEVKRLLDSLKANVIGVVLYDKTEHLSR